MSLFGVTESYRGPWSCAGVRVPPARAQARKAKTGNVIVYLDPMTTANVGGTVNLAPNGQATNFEVTLKPGEPPNDPRRVQDQVVQGSCSTPGRVVAGPRQVRADGKAKQEDGNVRLSDVRTGDHVIQVAGKDHRKSSPAG